MRPSATAQVTTIELVTKQPPVGPRPSASGDKPCSSRGTASGCAAAPVAGFAGIGSAPCPGSNEPARNNAIKIAINNRIRAQYLCREKLHALGFKPTFSRKPGDSASSPRAFQAFLWPSNNLLPAYSFRRKPG